MSDNQKHCAASTQYAAAIKVLVAAKEEIALVGKQGRSARNGEIQRRQAIYVRGWDDAIGALTAAFAPAVAGKCEHGIKWEMECLTCGPSDFVAAPAVVTPSAEVSHSETESETGELPSVTFSEIKLGNFASMEDLHDALKRTMMSYATEYDCQWNTRARVSEKQNDSTENA